MLFFSYYYNYPHLISYTPLQPTHTITYPKHHLNPPAMPPSQVDLNDPLGWVMIPLKTLKDQPVRAFMLQIAVVSNHQNGRDTHLRWVIMLLLIIIIIISSSSNSIRMADKFFLFQIC